ncbi:hypothetical protein D3C81_2201830 [compost metagenome]
MRELVTGSPLFNLVGNTAILAKGATAVEVSSTRQTGPQTDGAALAHRVTSRYVFRYLFRVNKPRPRDEGRGRGDVALDMG